MAPSPSVNIIIVPSWVKACNFDFPIILDAAVLGLRILIIFWILVSNQDSFRIERTHLFNWIYCVDLEWLFWNISKFCKMASSRPSVDADYGPVSTSEHDAGLIAFSEFLVLCNTWTFDSMSQNATAAPIFVLKNLIGLCGTQNRHTHTKKSDLIDDFLPHRYCAEVAMAEYHTGRQFPRWSDKMISIKWPTKSWNVSPALL